MATFDFLNSNGLDNSYQNTIDFDNLNAQQTFWGSQVITTVITNVTTSRILGTGTITLDISLENALNLNYCRLNQDGKDWYFFIVDRQFINENTTTFTIELDVMQTFMFDYELKESMVVREHQDRFTVFEDGSVRRSFSLTEENLAYGDTYQLENSEQLHLSNSTNANHAIYFACIQCDSSFANVPNYTNQPVTMLIPISGLIDQTHVTAVNLKLGYDNNYYDCPTIDQIYLFLQGSNQIYSFDIVPYAPVAVSSDSDGNILLTSMYPVYVKQGTAPIVDVPFIFVRQNDLLTSIEWIDNPSHKASVTETISSAPNIDNESKLWCFPYRFFNVGDNVNEPKVFKYEYLMGGSETISFGVRSSYSGIIKDEVAINNLLGNDIDRNAFVRVNPNNMPLVSDAWVNYYNSNKTTIQGGAIVRGAQTALNSAFGLAGAVASASNPAIGLVSGGAGVLQNLGNYVLNEIQINQKYKDIQQTPDTIRGVGNVGFFNLSTARVYFYCKQYTIPSEWQNKLFHFFMKFGYTNNSLKVPNLKSRYYFNFVQIAGAVINSSIANTFITQIRAILQRGITFWHYRNASTWHGIANYNFENLEMSIYNKQQEVNTNAITNSWF